MNQVCIWQDKWSNDVMLVLSLKKDKNEEGKEVLHVLHKMQLPISLGMNLVSNRPFNA